jgi:hypothetical protein
MKIIERFFKYLDFKGVKPTRFEKDFGLSNGYLALQLKRNGSLGEDTIINIINNCLDINMEWLLTGQGSMLKSAVKKESPPPPEAHNTGALEQLRKENAMQAKIIAGLEFKVATLEKELYVLKLTQGDPIVNEIVAAPAPELIKK